MKHTLVSRKEDAWVNIIETYKERSVATVRLGFNLYLINVVPLKDYKIKIITT